MPLAGALLSSVPSRGTSQAQGALQVGVKAWRDGECPKARHEHHHPVAVATGSPPKHAPPTGPQGSRRQLGLGHLTPGVRVRNQDSRAQGGEYDA